MKYFNSQDNNPYTVRYQYYKIQIQQIGVVLPLQTWTLEAHILKYSLL